MGPFPPFAINCSNGSCNSFEVSGTSQMFFTALIASFSRCLAYSTFSGTRGRDVFSVINELPKLLLLDKVLADEFNGGK